MFEDKASSNEHFSAGLIAGTKTASTAHGGGVYRVECVGADGKIKWVEEMPNLVVNEGLQDMNAKYFKGSSYTAAWYVGLITGPGAGNTYAAADTLASHSGWTEFTNYTGARKTATLSTATTADPSVISNVASPASFTISGAGGTVAGAFLASVDSGTTGVLFAEANFASPGDRNVVSGDTLNVSYTFSLAAT